MAAAWADETTPLMEDSKASIVDDAAAAGAAMGDGEGARARTVGRAARGWMGGDGVSLGGREGLEGGGRAYCYG